MPDHTMGDGANTPSRAPCPVFLAGGGETGALVRAHDWEATPLGPPGGWPQPLRTLVAVLLGSRQAMFVAWGPARVLLYNDGYAAILGPRHPAALGRPMQEVWPEIWPQLAPLFIRADAGESTHMDDIALTLRRNGEPEEAHFAFSYTPVRDEAGTVAGLFCACTETTARVLAERRSAAEGERLRRLFHQAPGFMCVLRGSAHVFEITNAAYAGLIGHRDVIGKSVAEALPEVEGQGFLELLDRVYATAEPFTGRWMRFDVRRVPGAAPDTRFVDFVYQPITDEAGRVSGIFVEGHDVTEAKLAEDALREERDRTRAVLESMAEGFWLLDRDWRVIEINAEAAKLDGRPREALLGRTHWELWPGSLGTPVEAAYRRAMAERVPVALEHHRVEDGQDVWLELRALPSGEGLAMFCRDIAERKYAEAALRESERRLKATHDNAGVGIHELDARGRYLGINDTFTRMSGYTMADLAGRSLFDLIEDAADRERAREGFARLVRGEIEVYADARSYVGKHGRRWWAEMRTTAVRGEDGRFLHAVRVIEDVTARKQAEDALRETAERYRLVSRATNDAIWDWDLDADRIQWNEAVGPLFGYDEVGSETDGHWWMERIHPDDRERVEGGILGVIAGTVAGDHWSAEYRFRRSDGGYADIYDRGYVLRDGGGRAVRMIGAMLDLTGRKRAEEALRESEARFRHMADSAPSLIWMTDADGRVNFANMHFDHVFGRPAAEMLGRGWAGIVLLEDLGPFRAAFLDALRARRPFRMEMRVRDKEGQVRWMRCDGVPRLDDAGTFLGYTGCAVDITEARLAADALEARVAERTAELRHALGQLHEEVLERERAEDELRQAQKMEAVGQLTGGIAHDFNNMLQGVVGSLELVRTRLAQGRAADAERFVTAAMGAAQRASALTHRLLAFARRQALDPKPVDVNRLVEDVQELLRRTVGPGIAVRAVLHPELWPTLCDANQLENALLNLAINARDAMPQGGKLAIETSNARLGRADTRVAGEPPAPGDYVQIAVSDTGTGMSPEVASRVFEPFFTTKPIGQGTGLGLSMLYGFVKQSGGHVRLDTAPGRGTTVRLYLPRHHRTAEAVADEAADPAAPHGSGGTVLLVEDEPLVRDLAVEALDALGYHVLQAPDGEAALRVLRSAGRVDLLVTDVGLPGMNGRQLADAARERRPGLKVLFITGYAHNVAPDGLPGDALEPGMALIGKPFALDALAAKVRGMIEG